MIRAVEQQRRRGRVRGAWAIVRRRHGNGRQGMAFIALGAVNTLIGFIWFVFFEIVVGPHTGYLVVLLLAHSTSVVCAFVLYRRLVFRVSGHWWQDLARFESVYLSALGLNLVLLPVLVEGAGLPVLAAQTMIVVVTAALSFFGHKYFSFRRPRLPSEQL